MHFFENYKWIWWLCGSFIAPIIFWTIYTIFGHQIPTVTQVINWQLPFAISRWLDCIALTTLMGAIIGTVYFSEEEEELFSWVVWPIMCILISLFLGGVIWGLPGALYTTLIFGIGVGFGLSPLSLFVAIPLIIVGLLQLFIKAVAIIDTIQHKFKTD